VNQAVTATSAAIMTNNARIAQKLPDHIPVQRKCFCCIYQIVQ
jgi:hypothetical protein